MRRDGARVMLTAWTVQELVGVAFRATLGALGVWLILAGG